MQVFSPNGTLTSFNLQRQDLFPQKADNEFFPLSPGFILWIYPSQTKLTVENFDTSRTYYGNLISLKGKIVQSGIFLGSTQLYDIVNNVDQSSSFMLTIQTKNTSEIQWKIYAEPNPLAPRIKKLYDGILAVPYNISTHKAFATVEGGFGLAFSTKSFINSGRTNYTIPPKLPSNLNVTSNLLELVTYVTFMEPNATNFGKIFLIDRKINASQYIDDNITQCFAKIYGTGFECSIGSDRISFLRSGAVLVITPSVTRSQLNKPLPYGGMLIEDPVGSLGIYDENGFFKQMWPLPVPDQDFGNFFYDILPNNTIWGAYKAGEDTNITVFQADLPKFFSDKGFNNPTIDSTSPSPNTVIPLGFDKLIITYTMQINMSVKNVSIYQKNGDFLNLRQTFSAQSPYCILETNGKTVSVTVLSSTFNIPNAQYFVTIDNNFVKNQLLDEPLFGVAKNDWTFTTADSYDGLLRLTPDGTSFFKRLSKTEAKEFIEQLRIELSQIIPIDLTRIKTSNRQQDDSSTPKSQTLLQFTILTNQNASDGNSLEIANNLNILIQNKAITQISLNKHTSFLDSDFGYKLSPNLWEKLRIKLIVVGVLLLALIIIFFWARWKFPEGKNFIIFGQTLLFVDLGLDIAFILRNGKDIPILFIPSLVILISSVTFNSALAVYILSYEIRKNPECHQWFRNYTKPASLLTILASADIEALNLFSSRFAGLKIFEAPFSKYIQKLIFWGSFCNLFIEDIPQLIIQIFYYQSSVAYDNIPFLTLITSSISVICNLIGRGYDIAVKNTSKDSDNHNDIDMSSNRNLDTNP
ncbi:hypothetical protein G9A89_009059 [Geosiphon pyriformis]|nr:hypothetical protein G9A89_009059 [Geosiphon pyriformis]